MTAALLIAATLANQVDPKPDEARLRLRRGCDLRRAYGVSWKATIRPKIRGGEFFKRAVRELRANPQFDSRRDDRSFSDDIRASGQYEVDGQSYLTDRDRPRGNFESVSDDYFTTLGLKILEGRDFTIDD